MNIVHELSELFSLRIFDGEIKILAVFDENTVRFGQTLKEYLSSKELFCFTLKGGEQNKSLNELFRLYELLNDNDFKRSDVIIAVGGGIVTDLTGFAAMTYMRGCKYVSVPTTLLCMIDAAFGGKTGVNAFGRKNLIGGFYEPDAVLINPSFLKTLPETEIKNGLCELIKYDMLSSGSFADMLSTDFSNIASIVEKAYTFKLSVTKTDFCDNEKRHILNFGHTVGHAIEELTNGQIPHGLAVAYGMVTETVISGYFGLKIESKTKLLLRLLDKFSIKLSDKISKEIGNFITADKKVEGSSIKAVFVSDDGDAQVKAVSTAEYLEALSYAMATLDFFK